MLVANPLFALLNKPVIHATKSDKSDNDDDEEDGEGKSKSAKGDGGDDSGKKDEKSKFDPKEYFERGLLEYNNGQFFYHVPLGPWFESPSET